MAQQSGVVVEARALSKALTRVLMAVERRNPIPILAMVRLRRRSDDMLEIAGTDLDLQVTTTCAAEVASGFACCANPRLLAGILRLLGNEPVRFDLVGSDLHLAWSSGRARFPTLPVDDFPAMSLKGEVRSCTLEASFVTSVLLRVSPAVSREETRYYLNGVCLDGRDETAKAVATDGHRLLTTGAGEAIKSALGSSTVIVPRRFAEIWSALARGDEAEFTRHGDAFIQVVTADVDIVGKVIDGAFPDWRRVLPKDGARIWEAPRAAIQLALKRLAALGEGKYPHATLMPGDAMRLQSSAASGYGGAVEVVVEGAVSSAHDHRGINLRYLQAAVDATRGATVRFEQAGPTDPALVIGSEDEPDTHVIVMGLRVTDNDAFEQAPALKRVA